MSFRKKGNHIYFNDKLFGRPAIENGIVYIANFNLDIFNNYWLKGLAKFVDEIRVAYEQTDSGIMFYFNFDMLRIKKSEISGEFDRVVLTFLIPKHAHRIKNYSKYLISLHNYCNNNEEVITFNSNLDLSSESKVLEYLQMEDEVYTFYNLIGSIQCEINVSGSTTGEKIRRFLTDLLDRIHSNVLKLSSVNNNELEKFIEFEPENYQAGLSILSYFSTYLKEQYPEEEAHVKIEQHKNSVKLTVKTETGEPKTIERAFNEYGMIMSGSQAVDEIVSDPLLKAKLENKIDLLNTELNSERRLNNLQSSTLKDFMEMFRISHKKVNNYQFILSNKNSNSLSVSINNEITSTIGTLKELKEALPIEDPLQNELNDITQSLDAIENETSPEVIKKSSALSKLKRFIDKVNKGQDVAASVIKTVDRGSEIFSSLVTKYQGLVDILNTYQ